MFLTSLVSLPWNFHVRYWLTVQQLYLYVSDWFLWLDPAYFREICEVCEICDVCDLFQANCDICDLCEMCERL